MAQQRLGLHRPTAETWAWAITFVTSGSILVTLAVLVSTGALVSTERRWWYWAANFVGREAWRWLEALTFVGISTHASRDFVMSMAILTALCILWLARLDLFKPGIYLGLAMVGTAGTVEILKNALSRSGPPLTPYTPAGHTFPSGTAAASVTLFGFIAILAFNNLKGPRRAGAVSFLILVSLGLTASAATYHYPSEVVGGMAVGLVWISALGLVPKLSRARSGDMEVPVSGRIETASSVPIANGVN